MIKYRIDNNVSRIKYLVGYNKIKYFISDKIYNRIIFLLSDYIHNKI